ncbi:MAG: isoleucine--tRNA ligase, partial [Oscillochloris sp.]|nr:isoleucine--tRNA ligase [Oscillochloris sp.]
LGRAARKGAGVKVRQPLAELWVRAANPAALDGIRRFEAELRDELNVKAVRYLDASADFVEYRFKPNLKLLGRKYGKLVPALTAALKELAGDAARATAHAVEAGQAVTLAVNGENLELLPEELLVESSGPAGYAVAEDNGTLVALNSAVTPELRLEGAARDLVRSVQDARKSAGLAISDRIKLFVAAEESDFLREMLAAWGDYVRSETLATDLAVGAAPEGAHRENVELGDGAATVGIVKTS